MPVKAGRDELVDLRCDHREGNECRAKQRQLQLRNEIFQKRGVNKLGVFRSSDPDERPYQHVVDLFGEEKTEDESYAESDQSLDQARAQLDQMIHQGRFAGLDILVAHDALASLTISGLSVCASWDAG